MQPLEQLFLDQLLERTSPIYEPLLQCGVLQRSEAREEVMAYFTKKKPALLDVYSRYAMEWDAYHRMAGVPSVHFASALRQSLPAFRKQYDACELNAAYYLRRIENSQPEERKSLCTMFLERWKRVLFDREYAWQLQTVDHLCETFVRELTEQSNALLNMGEGGAGLAPRIQWLTPRQDPELRLVLKRLSRVMSRNSVCQELSRILGRRRSMSPQMRRAVEEFHSRHHVRHAAPSDIVGVTEGNQLSQLLPAEYGLMSDPRTEVLFLRRYADRHLQMFDSISQIEMPVRPADEKGHDVAVPQSQGPFVVCVDSSGSMAGDPENIAKALVLAIGIAAEKCNRRCAVVMFSDQISSVEFDDLADGLPQLVRFFCDTFHGGTDGQLALSHAVSVLETRDFAYADLLLLSDCTMESPSGVLHQRIERLRLRGTCFYTVAFGNNVNEYYTQMSDKYWKI